MTVRYDDGTTADVRAANLTLVDESAACACVMCVCHNMCGMSLLCVCLSLSLIKQVVVTGSLQWIWAITYLGQTRVSAFLGQNCRRIYHACSKSENGLNLPSLRNSPQNLPPQPTLSDVSIRLKT